MRQPLFNADGREIRKPLGFLDREYVHDDTESSATNGSIASGEHEPKWIGDRLPPYMRRK